MSSVVTLAPASRAHLTLNRHENNSRQDQDCMTALIISNNERCDVALINVINLICINVIIIGVLTTVRLGKGSSDRAVATDLRGHKQNPIRD